MILQKIQAIVDFGKSVTDEFHKLMRVSGGGILYITLMVNYSTNTKYITLVALQKPL